MKSGIQILRVPFLGFIYTSLITFSMWVSLELRFDFEVDEEFYQRFLHTIFLTVPLKLTLLAYYRQFGCLLTYFSLSDAKRLFFALGISSLILIMIWVGTGGGWMVPRGVLVTDFVVSMLAFYGFRTSMRLFRERFVEQRTIEHSKIQNVAIIGAGSTGSALFREIHSKPGLGMRVVCFIDDDSRKIHSTLHGRKILGPIQRLPEIAKHLDLQKAILAIPGASPSVIQSTVHILNELGIPHDILPSVTQMLHRKVSVEFLRQVSPEDLLGRDRVDLDEEGIAQIIKNRTVLVTGAGGSIGSELCRQVASFHPERLILIERAEPALFAIEQELKKTVPNVNITPLATSVCRLENLRQIFLKFRPSLVLHAAAHKHVPLMESQPAEAFQNNCVGTANVARLCGETGCERAILVSTDKAVNPVNVMGATKRIAEIIWEQAQNAPGNTCRYSAVRFGNVLGSSGSVIPIFRQQIAQGGPVTVTHTEVTRYFMSIPEACGLILQSAWQAEGGEIFVLDMGEPVRIQDLARQMIQLSGFRPEQDIAITYTGLRPGEKLFEEPIHSAEKVLDTTHPKVKKLRPERKRRSNLNAIETEEIMKNLLSMNDMQIKEYFAKLIPEYKIWQA